MTGVQTCALPISRSDDGVGAGGVVLGWVFTVEGGAGVRVHRDGRGVMWGGRNGSEWVGIGESLTRLSIREDGIDLLCSPRASSASLHV